jgi:integrase/recombinase XerC
LEIELQSYLNYLRFERQYSVHTIEAYKGDLVDFHIFLNVLGIHSLAEISTITIRSWMVDLVERGLSNRSIHRKMASLRGFFKFLYKRGCLKEKLMDGIVLPKVQKRLPEYVELKPIDLLLDWSAYGADYVGVRDYFMIHLLYFTGIRRAELLQIQKESFDAHRRVLRVLGKGGKERLIPIGEETWEWFRKYVAIRNKEFTNPSIEDSFWLTGKGRRVYPKLIYGVVTKHLKRSGHFGKGSPHVLRHTFATHLSNEGAELNAIKDLLGHAGLAATQVYTHNSIKRLQEVYEKAHPKAE